jgi:hypothetical protein
VLILKCPFKKIIKIIEKREDRDRDSYKEGEYKIKSVEQFGHCIEKHCQAWDGKGCKLCK